MNSMKKIKVLLIGGTGYIGSAILSALANNNCDVVCTYYKNNKKADELVNTLKADTQIISSIYLDINDTENIKTVVKKANEILKQIDVLIIASGLATGHVSDSKPYIPSFFEISEDGYNKMFSTNVKGVFFICQEVAKLMANSNAGKIIIIGSIDGIKNLPAPVDYACCKAALYGLTQSLAKELGKYNILVNMIAPGILDEGIAKLLKDELREDYIKHCSLKRFGKASEIAKMAVFLASNKNTYLTGQAVIMDGGL